MIRTYATIKIVLFDKDVHRFWETNIIILDRVVVFLGLVHWTSYWKCDHPSIPVNSEEAADHVDAAPHFPHQPLLLHVSNLVLLQDGEAVQCLSSVSLRDIGFSRLDQLLLALALVINNPLCWVLDSVYRDQPESIYERGLWWIFSSY